MTEVWEEKDKNGPDNVEEGAKAKSSNQNNTEKNDIEDDENTKENNEESDLAKLREELQQDLENIKKEQMMLEEERTAFRTEMKRELEKIREEKMTLQANGESRDGTSIPNNLEASKGTQGDESPRGVAHNGTVVLGADEEAHRETGLDGMEGQLERIDPEIKGVDNGLSSVDFDELTIQLENLESELNMKVDFEAITKMSEDYGKTVERIENSITQLDKKIDGVIRDLEESGRKFGSYHSVVREIQKLDDKTDEILEEIGFGESLNVSKIPPNILENVYESTIDGIVTEIRRNFGSHDAENIIKKALEDVRTRTSGSELFYFDGRYLKTRNLAKAIGAKLISAKQVQTTYDELLNKLLEFVPGFKAKNFRAMIKLKSQEYSVDKTTLLLDRLNKLRDDITNLNTMFGTVSNRQNSIELEINSLIGSKVGKEDMTGIRKSVENITAKQALFDEMFAVFKEEQKNQREFLEEEIANISEMLKDQKKSKPDKKKKGAAPTPKKKEASAPPKEKAAASSDIVKKMIGFKKGTIEIYDDEEEGTAQELEVEGEEAEEFGEEPEKKLNYSENLILSNLPEKGFTFARIKKEILPDIPEEDLKKIIKSLIDNGYMSTVKRGRHTIYIRKIDTNGGE